MTADGHGTGEIMRRADTSKPTVWRWQERYLDEGVGGLKRDKTRPSRVPPLPWETRLKVIAKTVQESPPSATHWTRRLMAEAVGISPSSVERIWSEAGLKPHLTKSFKFSNDPMFEEKFTNIVGLYLDLPERAVVLCVLAEACFQHDEKSQIQAHDRTQPGLQLRKGRAATMTHDYKMGWLPPSPDGIAMCQVCVVESQAEGRVSDFLCICDDNGGAKLGHGSAAMLAVRAA